MYHKGPSCTYGTYRPPLGNARGEAEGRATVAGEGGRPQSAAAERHTGGALTLGCQTEAASVRWHPITMMGGGTAAARGRSAP